MWAGEAPTTDGIHTVLLLHVVSPFPSFVDSLLAVPDLDPSYISTRLAAKQRMPKSSGRSAYAATATPDMESYVTSGSMSKVARAMSKGHRHTTFLCQSSLPSSFWSTGYRVPPLILKMDQWTVAVQGDGEVKKTALAVQVTSHPHYE